jgi:hypothetical protein
MRLYEFSPNTLAGSFTDDLVISKLWLISEVGKIQKNFNTIYILGSWYGNLSLLLVKNSNIKCKKIINIDVDQDVELIGNNLAKKLGVDNKIKSMYKDANLIHYKQTNLSNLIINTSVNDMKNNGWFDNIPLGTLVALQNRGKTLDEFKFTEKLYSDKRELKDPETEYTRYMVIGYK